MNADLRANNYSLVFLEAKDWLHGNFDATKNRMSFDAIYSLTNKEKTPIEKDSYLSVVHSGEYKCGSCQKKIKKIYSGYCYVCLMKKASADMCVMNPYLCHFSKGTCREPEWGLSFCYQPHYVYLSFTDKFKVGITRKEQILTRWVDQGATMGSPICITASRHQAGTIEKTLTEILSDKSHWQKMLKSGNESPTEEEFKDKFNSVCFWLKDILIKKPEIILTKNKNDIEIFDNPAIVDIKFPVPENIEKIKSISLEKLKEFKGKITGIKGQYIYFGEMVLNMRNHEGFIVDIEYQR